MLVSDETTRCVPVVTQRITVQSRISTLAASILCGGMALFIASASRSPAAVLPVIGLGALALYCFYRALGGPTHIIVRGGRRCHILYSPFYYGRRGIGRIAIPRRRPFVQSKRRLRKGLLPVPFKTARRRVVNPNRGNMPPRLPSPRRGERMKNPVQNRKRHIGGMNAVEVNCKPRGFRTRRGVRS